MLISRQGSWIVHLTCRLHLANFLAVSWQYCVAVADKYFVRVFLISLLSQLNNRISASFSCSYLHTPPPLPLCCCNSAAIVAVFVAAVKGGGQTTIWQVQQHRTWGTPATFGCIALDSWMRQMCVKHPWSWSWGAPPIGVLIVVCKFLRIHKILTNTILKDANWVQLLLLLPFLLLLVLLLLQLSGDWCVQAPATDTQCLHKP